MQNLKITERICDVHSEACSSKKKKVNKKQCFAMTSWSWNENGMETHWLSGKEKILGAAVNKEGHYKNSFQTKEWDWPQCGRLMAALSLSEWRGGPRQSKPKNSTKSQLNSKLN